MDLFTTSQVETSLKQTYVFLVSSDLSTILEGLLIHIRLVHLLPLAHWILQLPVVYSTHHLWCFPPQKLEKFSKFPVGAAPLGSISVFACSKIPASCMCCCTKEEKLPQVGTHKFWTSLQLEGVRLSLKAPLLSSSCFFKAGNCSYSFFLRWVPLICLNFVQGFSFVLWSCRTFPGLWFINNSM